MSTFDQGPSTLILVFVFFLLRVNDTYFSCELFPFILTPLMYFPGFVLFWGGRLANLLLGVDKSLPLLPTETHHLVSALTIGLMSHPLHLWLHSWLPKAMPHQESTPREKLRIFVDAKNT